MKIRSVTPTPIVSATPVQPQTAEQHAVAVLTPAPMRVETEPMTVDLGGQQILLEPGEMAKVVDKINQTAQAFNHQLQFQIAEDKQRVVIRVIDTASGTVVREIPPEKLMDAFERMEAALGLLLDAKL